MATVSSLLADIASVGTDRTRGGYSRSIFESAELELREWFVAEAGRRELDVEIDRNGAIWAWRPAADGSMDHAIVTGSHLDSVPGGGAYDGPLGVASALAAVDLLDAAATSRNRALALVVFPEEEGARFGVPCLGSQLMTGALSPDRVRSLRDHDGHTFADAMSRAGLDPRGLGADPERLARIDRFIELHVEQGRGLIDLGRPVATASSILGHGRWRLVVSGQGNHAGTTLMADRNDPMLVAALIVAQVRQIGLRHEGTRATVGKLQPVPGGSNVIASRVDLWLDVRHETDDVVRDVVAEIAAAADELAAAEGCTVDIVEESYSGAVGFDAAVGRELAAALPDAPTLPTGAGHDAGVLAEVVPTGMLFVRNPTGISHSPEEFVEADDAEHGAVALAHVLAAMLD